MTKKTEEPTEPTIEELQTKIASDAEAQKSTLEQLSALTDELESFKVKHAAAEKHKLEQEKAAKQAIHEANKKSGDVEALEASWSEKYNTDTAQLKELLSERDSQLNKSTVGNKSLLMATELACKPEYIPMLQRYLADDMEMDISEGMPVIKVTQNGKASALTLDDLKEKMSNNLMFSDMIKGSMADGNGSPGESGGLNGATRMKRANWELLSQFDRSKFLADKGQLID